MRARVSFTWQRRKVVYATTKRQPQWTDWSLRCEMKRSALDLFFSMSCLFVFEFLGIMNNEVFVVRTLDFIGTCMCFWCQCHHISVWFLPISQLIYLRKVRKVGVGLGGRRSPRFCVWCLPMRAPNIHTLWFHFRRNLHCISTPLEPFNFKAF